MLGRIVVVAGLLFAPLSALAVETAPTEGQDYAAAKGWYEKAAAAGDATAMHKLGLLFEEGQGVAQDYAAARGWYEKAAAKGLAESMYNLGILDEFGRGVAQD
jgi:TPR repeat protein